MRARASESIKQRPTRYERLGKAAAQGAEDRGFEPRMVLPPNRISSAICIIVKAGSTYHETVERTLLVIIISHCRTAQLDRARVFA